MDNITFEEWVDETLNKNEDIVVLWEWLDAYVKPLWESNKEIERKKILTDIELDKIAEKYIQGFDYAIEISPNLLSLKKDRALAKSMFKVGYKKALGL